MNESVLPHYISLVIINWFFTHESQESSSLSHTAGWNGSEVGCRSTGGWEPVLEQTGQRRQDQPAVVLQQTQQLPAGPGHQPGPRSGHVFSRRLQQERADHCRCRTAQLHVTYTDQSILTLGLSLQSPRRMWAEPRLLLQSIPERTRTRTRRPNSRRRRGVNPKQRLNRAQATSIL